MLPVFLFPVLPRRYSTVHHHPVSRLPFHYLTLAAFGCTVLPAISKGMLDTFRERGAIGAGDCLMDIHITLPCQFVIEYLNTFK